MKQLMKRRNAGGRQEMKALAERFIGRDCILYTYNGQLEAVIKEVTDGALLIQRKDNSEEAVTLDFVVRIREFPRKKNGKKLNLKNAEISFKLPADDKVFEAIESLEADFRKAAAEVTDSDSTLLSIKDNVLTCFYQLYYRLDLN